MVVLLKLVYIFHDALHLFVLRITLILHPLEERYYIYFLSIVFVGEELKKLLLEMFFITNLSLVIIDRAGLIIF